MVRKIRTIPAGEFKAKCLALLDEVAETGEEIVVTKRGKPVAKIVQALGRPTTQEILDDLRGSAVFLGTEDEFVYFSSADLWEALKEDGPAFQKYQDFTDEDEH